MRTKNKPGEKINIVTLGCAKNLVDSEVLLTHLKGNNIDVSHESLTDEARVVVINTCGFIDMAKQESIDTIIRYADAKQDGAIDKLFVTGCLSERYKDDLRKEIPQVDDFFGTRDLKKLLRSLKADYKHELIGERFNTTGHFAYLKISEGCDRPCSFCAIPLMRGKHKSKPLEEVVAEATSLVRGGVKELLIIAQDSTYYGIDLNGKRLLGELLLRLSDIEGLEWIRLHYAFPSGFPMDVLDVMKLRSNVCNYLDIPLQHGSTKILKLMRRGITRAKTRDLLNEIRNKIPGIAIRTTLIAGHPGETEEDFAEMIDFVKESRFERLGVFAYSHEEDTHSFKMEDDVPEEVKQKRSDAIMELQQGISMEINQTRIGETYRVIVDRIEDGCLVGRTEYDSPDVDNEVIVVSDISSKYRPGDFVNVRIEAAGPFDLNGVIAQN